ncbi:hypothetical protein [Devosia sp. MC521]|uniref:hypothetical protein n=1 Tax=Devosia sp. MC521 TaxID=2759954 RepID=UPI0015F803DB|nr:hypothetical protein [Devosia sp. MC521]MBJ6989013.1 hypothetical protein [Devosia sp. MC521]QMW62971.1 hypothetical protein H4N61_00970 [Devosia sp. MC521]
MIEETSHSQRTLNGDCVLFALLTVPFLPYFPYGFRAEHILAILFSVFSLRYIWQTKKPSRTTLIPVASLAGGVVATVISSSMFSTAGAEAGIVNMFVRIFLAPLLFLSFVFIISREDIKLTRLADAVATTSAIIGGISVLSIFSPVAHFLHPFVMEDGVWGASRAVGRQPGIFNQPLEAGLFFGITAIIFVYKFRERNQNITIASLFLVVSLIGGSVSLSKTFVLGVGLAMIYAFFARRWLALLILSSSAIWIGASSLFLNPSGSYFKSLLALLNAGGPIAAVSAGRFGVEQAGNSEMAAELASAGWSNVLLGFGLGSKMPLDSGFLEYAYQGGLLALAGYLLFFAFFIWISFRHLTGEARFLSLFLIAFSVLASVGGPTITANRAGYVLILVLVGLLVAAFRNPPDRPIALRISAANSTDS